MGLSGSPGSAREVLAGSETMRLTADAISASVAPSAIALPSVFDALRPSQPGRRPAALAAGKTALGTGTSAPRRASWSARWAASSIIGAWSRPTGTAVARNARMSAACDAG